MAEEFVLKVLSFVGGDGALFGGCVLRVVEKAPSFTHSHVCINLYVLVCFHSEEASLLSTWTGSWVSVSQWLCLSRAG